jgi:hypothetical protein
LPFRSFYAVVSIDERPPSVVAGRPEQSFGDPLRQALNPFEHGRGDLGEPVLVRVETGDRV